jgi:hypothetical protein
MKEWKVEEIKTLLQTNDTMVCRSLVQLYNQQDDYEKAIGETTERNGVGFNGVDSPYMSSCAKFYMEKGFLSPRQMGFVRNKIMKYSKQITKLANQHEKNKIRG